MKRTALLKPSAILCMVASILIGINTFFGSLFSNLFSSSFDQKGYFIFNQVLFALELLVMLSSAVLFLLSKCGGSLEKAFAIAGTCVSVISLAVMIGAAAGLFSGLPYIVSSLLGCIFSVETVIALLAFAFGWVSGTRTGKSFGIAVLILYVIMQICYTVRSYLFYLMLEQEINVSNMGFSLVSSFENLVQAAFLLCAIFICIICLTKGQPAKAPLNMGSPSAGVCPNCGRANGPDANFCAVCATPLSPRAVPASMSAEPGFRCPSCGAPVLPDDRYCPLCGEKVGTDVS